MGELCSLCCRLNIRSFFVERALEVLGKWTHFDQNSECENSVQFIE